MHCSSPVAERWMAPTINMEKQGIVLLLWVTLRVTGGRAIAAWAAIGY